MSKIVTAISKIMGDVGSVKKDGENKFHNYKYATASDILHKLQPLLAREGIVIFQNECGSEFLSDGSVLAITYEFVIAHREGEIWPDKPRHTGMAAARNTKGGFDDKAGNKCHTAARKYFMLALFQIPTGDYEDADDQEDRPASKPASKPTAKASPIQPQAVAPPVDPETGEVSPHEIAAPSATDYGMKFIAAVQAARDAAEVFEWQELNRARLGKLLESAPGIHKRVVAAVASRIAALEKDAA